MRGSTPVSISDRADGVEVAAVDPLALVEHLLAHDPVLDVLEHVADLAAPVGEGLQHLGDGLLAHRADAAGPGGLVLGVDGGGHLGLGQLADLLDDARVVLGLGPGDLRLLVRLVDDLLLEADELLDPLLRHLEGLEHLGLGDLERAALDHDDRVGGAAHDQVEGGELELLEGRVEDPVPFDPAHAHRRQRAVPRHRREAERGRGGDDAENVGVVLLVGRQHGDEDLHFVLEPLREERPDRPVDQARGQDLVVRGPALALEEPAGDLARGVGLLAIFDGEGEEREGGDVGGYGDGGQHHRVAEAEDGGAGGLLREASGFQREWTSGELGLDPLYGHDLLSL